MKIVKKIVLTITLMANFYVYPQDLQDLSESEIEKNLMTIANDIQKKIFGQNLVGAAKDGNINEMRHWLDEGADVNYAVENATALRFACFYRLPENDFNIDQIALLICAGANYTEFMNHKSFNTAEEPVKQAFRIAIEERTKTLHDCKQCEENCAKLFKELGLYANTK